MRRYDKGGIRPEGIPEDLTRCVASVTDHTGWHFFQCRRKRGHGPNGEYCKQHAKIEARRQARKVRVQDEGCNVK